LLLCCARESSIYFFKVIEFIFILFYPSLTCYVLADNNGKNVFYTFAESLLNPTFVIIFVLLSPMSYRAVNVWWNFVSEKVWSFDFMELCLLIPPEEDSGNKNDLGSILVCYLAFLTNTFYLLLSRAYNFLFWTAAEPISVFNLLLKSILN